MVGYARLALLSLLLFLVACDGEFLDSPARPTNTPTAATITPSSVPASATPAEDQTPSATPSEVPSATPPPEPTTEQSPTATIIPSTSTLPAPTSTPETIVEQSPTPADQCRLLVLDDTTAYNRPSIEATVFSSLSPEMPVRAEGVTADGWIGFDPGIAQAPNVGPFRLRWVPTGPGIVLEGSACGQLPIVIGPLPGVCFAMIQLETTVWAEPAAESVIGAPLLAEDYVQAIGRSGSEWILVDLSVGNVGVEQQGWIQMGAFSGLNGPCENLPEVSTSS